MKKRILILLYILSIATQSFCPQKDVPAEEIVRDRLVNGVRDSDWSIIESMLPRLPADTNFSFLRCCWLLAQTKKEAQVATSDSDARRICSKFQAVLDEDIARDKAERENDRKMLLRESSSGAVAGGGSSLCSCNVDWMLFDAEMAYAKGH